MARACRVLEVPVVSGNVSLYNEYQDQPIFPTPIIGGLGLIDDASKYVSVPFPEEGLLVMLLGADAWSHQPYGLAGSDNKPALANLADEIGVPIMELGLTGGTRFKIGSAIDLPIDEIYEAWSGGLENALLG